MLLYPLVKQLLLNNLNLEILLKKLYVILFISLFTTLSIYAAKYVAPDGSDSNPGTFDEPFESIQKAQETVSAGDTVFIRGGKYEIREDQISKIEQNLFACISYLNKSGSPGKTIKYWAYPNEVPVFNFSAVKPANRRVVGIWVGGSYIHLKGLELTGIQTTIKTHTESYCIYSRSSHNIYEQISMHDNVGTGLRLYNGGNNLFLNCDAYRNWDNVSESGKGSNNDGFGCHPNSSGEGNVFKGCRAWFNSDDGFDIIRSDAAVVFDSCWAFYNGYSSSFTSLGDGNGFKAGGYAYDEASKIPNPVPMNTIQFCVAVGNKANGFYSNHHLNGNFWYNNSAYRNAVNYNMVNRESPQSDNINVNGYDHILINNLGYNARGRETNYIDETQNTVLNNSFNLSVIVSTSDFISLEQDQLTAPRKPDGTLPDIDFMHLVSGSDLIDIGLDIDFPFTGNAPDLGAFEYGTLMDVANQVSTVSEQMYLFQNHPNPFNPQTEIRYQISEVSPVRLTIYDVLGKEVAVLVDEVQTQGTYHAAFNPQQYQEGSSPSGVYIYVLEAGNQRLMKKMLLLK